MTGHRAVIAAGPVTVRRLCCDADESDEMSMAAVQAIDDPVALVGERPVAIDALWSAVLQRLARGHTGMTLVHPSWWSAARIGVLATAAQALDTPTEVLARAALLAASHPGPLVLVEIAERLVAVTDTGTGRDTQAVARRGDEHSVADEVIGAIATMTPDAAVSIDAPGETALAALISEALAGDGRTVVVGDAALAAAAEAPGEPGEPPARVAGTRSLRAPGLMIAAASIGVTVLVGSGSGSGSGSAGDGTAHTPDTEAAAATVLLEGRVALSIPVGWPTQRITAGPGSARVQVTAPSDPEAALHVTQSSTPGETLGGAAERLKRAFDTEAAAPAGVFVDFNPSDTTAGRAAVTYREVRATHEIRWSVFVDGSVRISVGCQNRPGARETIRSACEQAVRSAHAVD